MAAADRLTNPVMAIERLLEGKTTLKTQRATHGNIVCLGTEMLDHVQMIMNEDKEKAVAEAVEETERRASAKLNSEMELLEQILTEEKEREFEKQRQEAEKKMANIRRQCEVAEKKRARDTFERYKTEKKQALEDAAEKARIEQNNAIRDAIEELTEKLNKEADMAKKEAVNDALKKSNELFAKEKLDVIKDTEKRCEIQYRKQLQEAHGEYTTNLTNLEERMNYIQKMLDIERRQKGEIQEMFTDMKEDYKRFQDYTKNFHSDYLLP